MSYKVLYTVTGGVAGAVELPITEGDSKRPKEWETLEEAEAVVEAMSRINKPYSTVFFRYRAVAS